MRMENLNSCSKFVVFVFPVVDAVCILHIIFNDSFLSKKVLTVLALCSLFLVTCFLLILSRICVIRRKPFAKDKTLEQLWDTDLEFVNESEAAPHKQLTAGPLRLILWNIFFKNPYEFCIFRPVYGMHLITGFVFLVAFVTVYALAKYWNMADEFYLVTDVLAFPIIILIGTVYFIANSGFYVAKREIDEYAPFEEIVQVPNHVFVGKTVATFVTAGETHAAFVLFLASFAILCTISSNYIYHTSEESLRVILPREVPIPRRVVCGLVAMTAALCSCLLGGMVLASYIKVKRTILGIMEKNWERNLVAIEFLLQDAEVETLEDLKQALDNKRNQELTTMQRRAFEYISRPMWRTKQPFMGRWAAVPEAVRDTPAEDPEEVNVQEQPRATGSDSERVGEQDKPSSPDETESKDEQPPAYDVRRRPQRDRSTVPQDIRDTPAGTAKSRRAKADASAQQRSLRSRKNK